MQASSAQEGQPGNALLLVGPYRALQLLWQLNVTHLDSKHYHNGEIRSLVQGLSYSKFWL